MKDFFSKYLFRNVVMIDYRGYYDFLYQKVYINCFLKQLPNYILMQQQHYSCDFRHFINPSGNTRLWSGLDFNLISFPCLSPYFQNQWHYIPAPILAIHHIWSINVLLESHLESNRALAIGLFWVQHNWPRPELAVNNHLYQQEIEYKMYCTVIYFVVSTSKKAVNIRDFFRRML